MSWFKVCPVSQVFSAKPSLFVVDDLELLLVKNDQGKIFAFENKCTHADKPLLQGKWDAVSSAITCPYHKAVFNLSMQSATPPAPLPLILFSTEIRLEAGEENVYVELNS